MAEAELELQRAQNALLQSQLEVSEIKLAAARDGAAAEARIAALELAAVQQQLVLLSAASAAAPAAERKLVARPLGCDLNTRSRYAPPDFVNNPDYLPGGRRQICVFNDYELAPFHKALFKSNRKGKAEDLSLLVNATFYLEPMHDALKAMLASLTAAAAGDTQTLDLDDLTAQVQQLNNSMAALFDAYASRVALLIKLAVTDDKPEEQAALRAALSKLLLIFSPGGLEGPEGVVAWYEEFRTKISEFHLRHLAKTAGAKDPLAETSRKPAASGTNSGTYSGGAKGAIKDNKNPWLKPNGKPANPTA